jgi:hypothetical protein
MFLKRETQFDTRFGPNNVKILKYMDFNPDPLNKQRFNKITSKRLLPHPTCPDENCSPFTNQPLKTAVSI